MRNKMFDFELCELCDNYTETVQCVDCGEDHCSICYGEYGCDGI
jgi:hypothetical protein